MRRGGGLLSGLLLVALGVVLLLNTLGILDWRVWTSLSRLWPLLLVVGGVNLLFGKTRLGGLFVLILVLVAAGVFWYGLRLPGGEAYALQLHEAVPAGARAADYTLRFGGGQLHVGSAPSGTLIAGDVNARSPIERRVQLEGGVAHVTLSSNNAHGWFQNAGLADWELAVSPDLPADFTIDAGAAQMTLDLREVPLKQLTVNSGAGRLSIQLGGRAGTSIVDVHVAAADVELTLPRSTGIRMSDTGLINSTNLTDAGLVRTNGVWETPGYEQAASRVEVHLSAAASRVNLNRVDVASPSGAVAGGTSAPPPVPVSGPAATTTL